jgi:low affinity Fe/Cu permease
MQQSVKSGPVREAFRAFAQWAAERTGAPGAFIAAALLIVVWLASGPALRYSDTWQLAINTMTTIITFLMVFLIQNSQGRDTKAIQLKLDELLKAVKGARTELVDLEHLSDDELDQLQREFQSLRERQTQRGSPAEQS